MDKKEIKEKNVKILPSIRRLIHTKSAHFCVSDRGSDIYHLFTAFNILKGCTGDKPLEDYYGDKYPLVKKKLMALSVRMNKLKLFYDSIPKEEIEEKIDEIFINSNIPLCDSTLFNCFRILLDKTEIRFMSIPNDCFTAVERTYKSFDIKGNKEETKDTKAN